MEEQWTVIVDAPNYWVSDLGRIRNVAAKRFLKGAVNSEGYLWVTLRHRGKDVSKAIHRLVAEYFIPNPDNLPEVNHIKGIKTDNRAGELEWCTKEHNLNHALKIGLRKQYRGGKINACKKITDTVSGQEFNSIKEAARFKNINYNTLRSMLAGNQINTSSLIYSSALNNKQGDNIPR